MTVEWPQGERQSRHNRFIHARRRALQVISQPLHVSIVAIPQAMSSTLNGLSDTLAFVGALSPMFDGVPDTAPFVVEIVSAVGGPVVLPNGLAQPTHRAIGEVADTDVIIVPSLLVPGGNWQPGEHDALVAWMRRMHERGATLCSACSGIFLLGETGLFDGHDVTAHWVYASAIARLYPRVKVSPERALVVSGERDELVSCGASTSWHDLVLYLIARFVGPTAAQAAAKFYAMQWHADGIAPFIVFEGRTGHGDAVVE